MKRFLSLIIASMLVIGMIPIVASAAETQVISFLGHTGKTPLDISYDSEGWEVNQEGTCSYLLGDKWNTTTYLNASSGLYVYFDTSFSDAERAAIDFKVNETNWYDVSLNVSNVVVDSGSKKPFDGYMSVWIDGKYAGQIDTTKGKGRTSLRPMYLEEGKHTFFVCVDRSNQLAGRLRCIVSDITLTPTTAQQAALKDVFVSLEKSSMGMGDMSQVYATLLFENDLTINLYSESLIAKKFSNFQTSDEKFEVTVENTDLVTASGNVVTGKDVGETKVIFTAELGANGTKSKSTLLKVNPKFTLRYKDEKSWETSAATKNYFSSTTLGNNWTLVTDTKYTDPRQIDGSGKAARIQSTVSYVYLNTYGPLTVNLDAPYAGLYDITMEHTAYSGNGTGDVFVNDEYIGTFNDNGTCGVTETIKSALLTAELVKGNNRITVYPASGSRIFPVAIDFASTETPDTLSIDATVSSSEINKRGTANITVTASASDGTIYNVKNSLFGGKTLKATYSSNNDKVAVVSESGVITGVGAGKAEITVSATYPGCKTPCEKKLTVTVIDTDPGEAAKETVSVYVATTTGGEVSAIGVNANEVVTTDAGKEITAKATASEGYKFSHWKDSSENFVSDKEEYNFKAYTNTSIVAVFDKIGEDTSEIGVEFFDGNRNYLGFKKVEQGTVFKNVEKPAYGITGYEFRGWSIGDDEKINSKLRAVAIYSEEGNPVSGITVNEEGKTANYGDEIKAENESAKAWYRDGELVAYGSSYTYFAWGDTAITSSDTEPEKKIPLVVLNTKDDSYMIEYDAAGYEIVDAGIIFGNETHNEVNSCYYKAKVKNIKPHGQFTAKKSLNTDYDQSVVRGYVIFRDEYDALRVLYSK